ncbi:MAG TPA: hypothetical protein VEP90_12130 [Methylomirabilota bacterium]|nr:hypothetical protein [Methylomirabilota bacterium]
MQSGTYREIGGNGWFYALSHDISRCNEMKIFRHVLRGKGNKKGKGGIFNYARSHRKSYNYEHRKGWDNVV